MKLFAAVMTIAVIAEVGHACAQPVVVAPSYEMFGAESPTASTAIAVSVKAIACDAPQPGLDVREPGGFHLNGQRSAALDAYSNDALHTAVRPALTLPSRWLNAIRIGAETGT